MNPSSRNVCNTVDLPEPLPPPISQRIGRSSSNTDCPSSMTSGFRRRETPPGLALKLWAQEVGHPAIPSPSGWENRKHHVSLRPYCKTVTRFQSLRKHLPKQLASQRPFESSTARVHSGASASQKFPTHAHIPRHRNVAGRADDWLRLRRMPFT